MIEGIKPKDIRKYKTKFIRNFTLKQVICFVIGVVLAYIVYFFQKRVLGMERINGIGGYVCMAFALIPISFGYIEPQGMSLYKYLKIMISDFRSPEIYIYKVDNDYKREIRRLEKESKVSLSASDRRKIEKQRKISDKDIKSYL